MQKTLEDANVKLTRVVTDILGVSGRAILAALIGGETDPERLADCTTGRLKASRADIVAAVHRRVTPHHRFLLKLHLAQVDALTAVVQQVEQQADEVLRPFREAADRLTTMPGVSETVARVIIAEIGVDTTRFPSAGHLVWVRLFFVGGPEGPWGSGSGMTKTYLIRRRRGEEGDGCGLVTGGATGGATPSA